LPDYTDAIEGRLMRSLKGSVIAVAGRMMKTRIKARQYRLPRHCRMFVGHVKKRLEEDCRCGPVERFVPPARSVLATTSGSRCEGAGRDEKAAASAQGVKHIAYS